MASSGCRNRRIDGLPGVTALLVLLGGCATSQPADTVRSYAAGVALPAGAGREILENQCLICHELEALELFSDFYTRDLWRSLVISMRANGAQLDDAQVEVVADYLARHFGVD